MHDRQAGIRALLLERREVRIRDLARQFGVSEMTIRRDLDELAALGLLVRTHGGAAATSRLHPGDDRLPCSTPSARKVAIGKLAAELVLPGQTIMVDSGTTTLEMVRHLRCDARTTVATVSMLVAQELYASGANLVFVGGTMRNDFPGVNGPLTERWLSDFRVDTLFVGCDGAHSEDGFYLADVQSSSLVQAMIRISERIVVVSESSKFGRRAFVRYATPQQVSTLVTDADLPVADRSALEERNVRILTTETE